MMFIGLFLLLLIEDGEKNQEPDLARTFSYMMGTQMGESFRLDQMPIILEHYMDGLSDGMAGSSKLSEAEKKAAQLWFRERMKRLSAEQTARDKEINDRNSKAFLAANKTSSGVQTTASGLQYKILKTGEGSAPKTGDRVVLAFEGRLLNGKVFSGTGDQESVTLEVNKLFNGWREGVMLMKPGAHFKLFIPPELGYGERRTPEIPENTVLVMDLKLLAVQKS